MSRKRLFLLLFFLTFFAFFDLWLFSQLFSASQQKKQQEEQRQQEKKSVLGTTFKEIDRPLGSDEVFFAPRRFSFDNLEVKATFRGEVTDWAGVIFGNWNAQAGAYIFEVGKDENATPTTNFSLKKDAGSDWEGRAWVDAKEQMRDDENILEMKMVKDNITLYLNGERIGVYKNELGLGDGEVGLYSGKEQILKGSLEIVAPQRS